MFFVKAIYCRIFQGAFRIAMPLLPYREPKIVNSCSQLGDVMKDEKITSVLVVTDKGIVNNGIVQPVERALNESGVSYVIYDSTKDRDGVALMKALAVCGLCLVGMIVPVTSGMGDLGTLVWLGGCIGLSIRILKNR